MQGHSAANVVPVVAANRYGLERVTPCPENGGQTSALQFYGSSFLTDETGAILQQAGREGDVYKRQIYFHGPFQSNNGGGRNSNRPPVLQAFPICAAPTIEYYIFLGMSNPSFKGIPSFIGSG